MSTSTGRNTICLYSETRESHLTDCLLLYTHRAFRSTDENTLYCNNKVNQRGRYNNTNLVGIPHQTKPQHSSKQNVKWLEL
mmetsp:Transcript_43505/g.86461  ORF Transcript_43505/g.86461 Transcript_43505/m.86461 type:complete len:81 (+) Transcript_43505:457-699(+)